LPLHLVGATFFFLLFGLFLKCSQLLERFQKIYPELDAVDHDAEVTHLGAVDRDAEVQLGGNK
jgi:hypothetical protein